MYCEKLRKTCFLLSWTLFEIIADSIEEVSVKNNLKRFSFRVEFVGKDLAAQLPKVVGFRKCSKTMIFKQFGLKTN